MSAKQWGREIRSHPLRTIKTPSTEQVELIRIDRLEPMSALPVKTTLLRLNINRGTRENTLQTVTAHAKNKKKAFVCFANVHMCVTARMNKAFAATVNSGEITAPDGMPVVIALKLLYAAKQERIDGISFLPDMLKRAADEGLAVFFYGSTNEVLNLIIERAQREFPHLRVAGCHAPPFRPMSRSEKIETIARINLSRADLLFVALGCPKQELWMASMKDDINPVMIGIGAAFPVYAGLQKRAPAWMQKCCLEWLFRLFMEPRRLFRRYFITNSLFFLFFIQDLVTVRFLQFFKSALAAQNGQIKS